jgi:hypothetical protein
MHKVIDITPVATATGLSGKQLGRCDGCPENWYSAPGGQQLKPYPHSRCLALARDIPMVLDVKGSWMYSEKPTDCPRLPTPSR